MEVSLTIQNEAGELGHVTAAGADYEAALAAARALVPDDCKAIVIRSEK